MLEVRTSYNLMLDRQDFVICEKDSNGRITRILKPIEELSERTPGGLLEPSFALLTEQAQKLMDQLWNSGIRPTREGSIGQLEAVKYHLEDMRKLVFKKEAK